MRSTACVKALTHQVAKWQKGGARALAGAFLREEEKDWELQRNAKSLRVWPPSPPAELSPTRQRKNWRDGRSVIQSQSGPGMRGQRSLLPALALPLERYSSSEIQMPDVKATGGIVEIPLAQTGEGIADCELINWFVQEGDYVDEFHPICEVQSDKASVVITSRYKGKVSMLTWMPGDIIKVGETLLELILEGADAEVETQGDASSDEQQLTLQSACAEEKKTMNSEEEKVKLATPAVRHLAKTYGVNLTDMVGSGKDGRIMKHDVLDYVASRESTIEDIQTINEAPVQPLAFQEPEGNKNEKEKPEVSEDLKKEFTPVPSDPSSGLFIGEDTIIHVRGYRRAMAKAMAAAAAVPHFHYMEEIEVDKLVALKSLLSQSIPLESGIKLTYLPFLIKSLSMALQKHPIMNSTVNESVTEIQVRASHNIGVAMATSFGLVVPNIKNVQQLSVLEIATELSRLLQLARTNLLGTDDITGGTITVSNFGAIGGKFGSPVLNIPEVAIVAIGRMQKVVQPPSSGKEVATVMNVTWGADHRVIDGATVARFCNEWKLLVEQPERLLLHLR